MIFKENILKYDDYCSLRDSVGWSGFSEIQAMHALEHNLYNIVAMENDNIVGMGRVIGDGLYYIIVDIIVKPEYQGQGIGSKLVRRLIEYIDNQTPSPGRASIQLIAEKGKEAFYERMGFKIIPHENCGSGMRKVINKS